MLLRKDIEGALNQWYRAWNEHDLDGVMEFIHDDIIFEHWTGSTVAGKESLRRAWLPWFINHGGFKFTEEATFIDEIKQSVLAQWQLEWPSLEKKHRGAIETRRGVDILHFQDGKIIKKITYSKTSTAIQGEKVPVPLLKI